MLYLLHLDQNSIQIFREERGVFERQQGVVANGVNDTVQKVVGLVEGIVQEGARTIVFRGIIANAMFVRDRRVCSNLELGCYRCMVSVCFFYAKSCIRLDKVGTLLQTADGNTKFRKGTRAVMNLGEGNLHFVEMRRSLNQELTENIELERRRVVEEAVSSGGSLELLAGLDGAFERMMSEHSDLRLVLDSEGFAGGFTSEVKSKIG